LPTPVVVSGAWVEADSPLIDSERLYRRPVFLLVAIGIFGLLLVLAAP
jgi:hypothetical protein